MKRTELKEQVRQKVKDRFEERVNRLLEQNGEEIRSRLLTEPDRAGVAVWYHDGEFIVEPVIRYGLKLLPDHPGFPIIVFAPGEYLKLSRSEMVDWILSSLERRILEHLEA